MASPSAFRAQYLAAKRENERRSKPKAKPKARKAPEPGLKDYATSGLSALYAAANPQQTAFAIGKDLVEAAPGITSDVVDYFGSNSPMDVLSDVGSGLRRAGGYMLDNPVSTAADLTPIMGDVKGFGEDIQRAAELRAAGNPLAARNIERIALPLAVASIVPGIGEVRGAGKMAVRAAEDVAPRVPAVPRAATAPTLRGTRDLSAVDFDPNIYGLQKTRGGVPEIERLADLAVKVEHHKPTTAQRASLGVRDIAEHPVIGTMSDRTGADETITALGNIDLDIPVHQWGGQGFMQVNPDYGWAVSTPGVASGIMNRARALYEETGILPLLAPYRMVGSGSDFAKTTGELMMSHANSAFGADDKARVNAMISGYIKDFKGIDNPEGYAQFGDLPTEKRKALQEELQRSFAGEGALTLPLTRVLMAEPAQLNKPSYGLQNIGVIDPRRDVLVDFTKNPTYGYNLPVKYLGTMEPDINIAEVLPGPLTRKYSDLGDLSVFRGQSAPLSPGEWRHQMKQFRADQARFEAGETNKPPRTPVRSGNTQKFLQPGISGFLDADTAQTIQDRLDLLAALAVKKP